MQVGGTFSRAPTNNSNPLPKQYSDSFNRAKMPANLQAFRGYKIAVHG
jgi:hypothetical protein